jgi:hypothetical protein
MGTPSHRRDKYDYLFAVGLRCSKARTSVSQRQPTGGRDLPTPGWQRADESRNRSRCRVGVGGLNRFLAPLALFKQPGRSSRLLPVSSIQRRAKQSWRRPRRPCGGPGSTSPGRACAGGRRSRARSCGAGPRRPAGPRRGPSSGTQTLRLRTVSARDPRRLPLRHSRPRTGPRSAPTRSPPSVRATGSSGRGPGGRRAAAAD